MEFPRWEGETRQMHQTARALPDHNLYRNGESNNPIETEFFTKTMAPPFREKGLQPT